MAEREKVIKALEHCKDEACRNCPYPCYREYEDDWPSQLMSDALELLKGQEPRVLTLEEVHGMPCDTPLCIEEVYGSMYMDVYNGIDMESGDLITGSLTNCPVYWIPEEYGRIYRFWTTKPTAEQRKAVKWDD